AAQVGCLDTAMEILDAMFSGVVKQHFFQCIYIKGGHRFALAPIGRSGPCVYLQSNLFVLRRAERRYGFRISASRTAVRVRTRAPLSAPLHRRKVARRSADRWAVRSLQNRKAVMPPVAWSG